MSGRLLITGGTGTLGSHLVRQAVASGQWDEIHATFHEVNPIFQKVYWHYLDAREGIVELIKKAEPTHLIHTLAMSFPDDCERNKLDAWQINVSATKRIAECAVAEKIRLMYLSTDMVFEGSQGRYAESDTPQPVNFYGDTKLEGEEIVKALMHEGGHVIVRLANLYGSNLNERNNFFDTMVHALKTKNELSLFTDQFRSMMSASNAAEALLELTQHTFEGVLHLGGPDRISRYEFGRKLAAFMGRPDSVFKPVTMKEVFLSARRPSDVSLDISAAVKILKTRLLSVDEGIKQVVIPKG